MSVLLWGGNVLDDMSVSSSVRFLLIEGSVPVKDCAPTVIPLQYIQCTGQSLPVPVVDVCSILASSKPV